MTEPVLGSARPTRVFSDTDLLTALRAGDSSAFERLVTEYGPRLRATALRLTRNEADANDVVQETFLAAFRSLTRFKGNSRLGTWLHRIAINAALMRIRGRERRPELDIHDLLPRFGDAGQHLEAQLSFRELPEESAAREEATGLVRGAIDRLPENYRNALLLHDIEGLEYPEVARQLGLTLNAARIRIHRARQALRKLLEPHFGGRKA